MLACFFSSTLKFIISSMLHVVKVFGRFPLKFGYLKVLLVGHEIILKEAGEESGCKRVERIF